MALAIKFGEAATTADPQFPTVLGRVANELCYFTIESNLIVVGVCAALAWRPERWRWVAGAPRLVGLVAGLHDSVVIDSPTLCLWTNKAMADLDN